MATADLTPAPPARSKISGLPIDVLLLVIVAGLAAFGLMMVYSATFDWSYRQYGDSAYIFLRQVRWLALGVGVMLVLARIPYRLWRYVALPGLVLTMGMLLLVLFFGASAFGAQRSFFNGSVQPSELAKFVTIIYMAVWLDSKGDKIHVWGYGLIPFGIIVGAVAGLILAQPDISAAATVVIVAAIMFFVAGADLLQMGAVGALAAGVAALVVQSSATGRQRLADYLAGMQDITRASWHVQQAAIAFVNGGLLGRGLGESRQKYGFLPTPHTDSIFAIIGEELGLLGCLLVILLLGALVWRGYKIATQARNPLGAALAAGFTCWVALEALINISVMVGMMPFAGNPLPFISYGGSNLVMMFAAVGVLLSVSRREDDPAEARPRRIRPLGQLFAAAAPSQVKKRDGTTFDLSRRDGGRRVPRLVRRE